ncbi:putative lipid II flippase FtsW [Idiomarina loihiensis]|jgi:cell division protein FtsW|uniref:Probable peptidoglycan glycosyltransferase FtsW n=1 Tax=Idiomarina loihiensis (strain ATCC BAA-735 / DSM 15497 / L2-TR) TaxID=283942 RepID=FTSW_IDILO|nr:MULTISPECIES: putative lipid II flippase FtsW [Idiomarina]Q5R0M2.1 RecName: Full=Probable peptidoglycan glycosyltransferase FtsW; Short=PGT; AltName: Full=Cell division protein FtsW; AltName: Full=Cell wall polymerase; AltName: Full=Peptidoglycan polymerase; Short=PG polymerase [Idiomarina loihiensis L2TR]NWO01666.1 putative lipid II flippase FtsW [Idiomarinaceae bacterium]AAV81278.1 Bacterial cell division membrane protein [Idiomarina loihiensis L2TR]AGM35303.1 cell division membrane protei|tara:strand:+ start:5003 stop:6232 length:1230 start_codon:yes stop_codon:yes gene_type:complete
MSTVREEQLNLEIPASDVGSRWQKLINWFQPKASQPLYDRMLFTLAMALLAFGFVMVTSASLPTADRLTGNPFHFAIRHGIYILISLAVMLATLRVPANSWNQQSGKLLLLGLIMLLMVLVVGYEVNGAQRWIKVGPITFQAAEVAKLFFCIYMASYLSRREDEVREATKGFIKPLALLFIAAVLLLMQPDFGTVVVLSATTVAMLFLAGARLWQFFAVFITCVLALILLIIVEPYRMQRLLTFLEPEKDPFGAGYQLMQSLIAFGQGHFSGAGLGNSIQKLQYLPEAHTDFIMAVVAEELGFLGVLAVIATVLMLVWRALIIGRRCLMQEQRYGGYLAYGIGIWFSIQAFVNIGVASGALPTKGLTLPLVSYGGNSLIISALAVGLLLRIDHERRMLGRKVAPRGGAE